MQVKEYIFKSASILSKISNLLFSKDPTSETPLNHFYILLQTLQSHSIVYPLHLLHTTNTAPSNSHHFSLSHRRMIFPPLHKLVNEISHPGPRVHLNPPPQLQHLTQFSLPLTRQSSPSRFNYTYASRRRRITSFCATANNYSRS